MREYMENDKNTVKTEDIINSIIPSALSGFITKVLNKNTMNNVTINIKKFNIKLVLTFAYIFLVSINFFELALEIC